MKKDEKGYCFIDGKECVVPVELYTKCDEMGCEKLEKYRKNKGRIE